MKSFRITGSDVFTAFQILMAYFYVVPQVFRMFESVQGVTINWLLCATLFIILNLYLSVNSYRKVPNRSTLQVLMIYANWVVLLVPMVILTFIKCRWTNQDSLVFMLVMGSAVIVFVWGKAKGLSLSDPVIRGSLVGLFRVVPHIYLSYCMVKAGGSGGIAWKTVLAGNITATARVITLFYSGRKSGWEKGAKASFLSEILNESSWLVASTIWFVYR